MHDYTILFVNDEGTTCRVCRETYEDDKDALEKLSDFVELDELELWRGDELIWRFGEDYRQPH